MQPQNHQPSEQHHNESGLHNSQQVDRLQDVEKQIQERQDHLRELKTSIQAREHLLSKLREIGEKSKADTSEYYYRQLNRLNDEMALKDKQMNIHIERIKDLEKLLSVSRAQASESRQLGIQLRVDDS